MAGTEETRHALGPVRRLDGGPIIRDKLFFFGDYEGLRYRTPASQNFFNVFTTAERQGDFSRLLTERNIQLFNPFQLDANGNRVPFANNQIPLTLIDPVAQKLFSSQFYPPPVNENLERNQINTLKSSVSRNQGDIKIDASLTDNDRLFGRYSEGHQDNPVTNSFPLYFGSFFTTPARNGVINWTGRKWVPGFVNEVRVAANRTLVHNGGNDNGLGNVAEQLGIQNGNDRETRLDGHQHDRRSSEWFWECEYRYATKVPRIIFTRLQTRSL